jgi:hypothetical protein
MEDGEEPWAAERSIKASLMHHEIVDDVYGVRSEAFVLVAAKLADFKRRPVTNQDMAKLKKQGGKQTDDRKNLTWPQASSPERLSRGNGAIFRLSASTYAAGRKPSPC